MNKAVESFGDENQEIDIETILKHYEQSLFENGELRIDIKTMIPSQFEWVKDYLPNKIILFKTDDLKHIFSEN
jgi:hypothetical protein